MGGMRNADRRNGAGCHRQARCARSAGGTALPADVQPAVVSDGLRQVVRQQGCDDAGGHRGDRGRHVPGQDRGDHRRTARRALPVAAGEAGLHPGRGCHTALSEVVETWKGTHWFIEGDISDCFGSLDHEIMIKILAEKIHDGRFLQLISHMLKAGYLEDWRWHATLSGSPQGGIASPVLSNIYLDRLDQYVEQRL